MWKTLSQSCTWNFQRQAVEAKLALRKRCQPTSRRENEVPWEPTTFIFRGSFTHILGVKKHLHFSMGFLGSKVVFFVGAKEFNSYYLGGYPRHTHSGSSEGLGQGALAIKMKRLFFHWHRGWGIQYNIYPKNISTNLVT